MSRGIESAIELSELGLALLAIRPAALFRLFGVVVETERLHAHAGDAADRFRIGIERALSESECRRTALEQFLTPAINLGVEFVVRNGDVREPHLKGLRCRVTAAKIPHLPSLLLADHAPKIGGAKSRIDGTDFRPDLTELCPLRSDRQIANRSKHVAAANCKAVDPGDDGFRHIANKRLELVDG